MSILPLYHWDFDRIPADRDPAFLTMSIAIFQWLPRSSGKGLKKVNCSRVHGYQIERHRVYAKAQEVCDRLNSEQASALERPPWLQKQYSVPRPTTMPVERRTDQLSPATVRSIRERVMKQQLLPLGFVKSADATYVRKQGNQIHVINFQGSRYGGQYTVNLGFHYDFLFPDFAWKMIPLGKYVLVDCALQARIGNFIGNGHDRWFEYGLNRPQLAETFAENIAICQKVLARYGKKWANPDVWLEIPRNASSELPHQVGKWHLPLPWSFLAGVAIKCGRWKIAESAIDELLILDFGPGSRKRNAKIGNLLRRRMSKRRMDR